MQKRFVTQARHLLLDMKLSLNNGVWHTHGLWLFFVALAPWLVIAPANAQNGISHDIFSQRGNGVFLGLAQPFISLSHFVFIVMMGLVASRQARGGWILLLFVASSCLGMFLRSQGWSFEPQEAMIMASIITLGVMHVVVRFSSLSLLLILGAIAGLLYGYACGSTTLGESTQPLVGSGVGYGVGYGVVQITIGIVALIIGRLISNRQPGRFAAWMQWIGVGMMGTVVVTSILKAAGILNHR